MAWDGDSAFPAGAMARLQPHLLPQHPSLDADWHPILARNPTALSPEAGPDRVWLMVNGRARLLPRAILEFR